jgi:peptidyl-prolyl cis-trans isomerase B (cyclophilin B)
MLLLPVVLMCACAGQEPKEKVQVLLQTSEGDITVLLHDDTPLHRDNFIKNVKEGVYDGVLFHRVIPRFMIQAGDPQSRNPVPGKSYGSGDLGYRIPAEILPYKYHIKGMLAAARTNNPQKESSSCQFYIVQGNVLTDNDLDKLEAYRQTADSTFRFSDEIRKEYTTVGGAPHLDGEYTIFGQVVSGIDVVDKIAAKQTDRTDRPLKDVFIKKAKILKK